MEHLYLDYCATTPVRPEVLLAMTWAFENEYGNPSSFHERGHRAKILLETARETVATAIGAHANEIIFTGNGTEANNLAILGFMRNFSATGGHVITSQIEHPSVLNCFHELERRGFDVTYVPVSKEGVIRTQDIRQSLRPDTRMVSIMMANNEIGTIQPVSEISALCQAHGIVMHSDAVQAVGKIPAHVAQLQTPLLTFSAHKMYGPKGVGVLYMRRKTKVQPIIFGGGQERRLRSGTQSVALIHGTGIAVSLAMQERETEMNRLRRLRDQLRLSLLAKIQNVQVTTGDTQTLPYVLHIVVQDILGEALLLHLDRLGIQVSAGSACSSGRTEPSPVLQAMGVPDSFIHGALRISLGTSTTAQTIDHFVNTLFKVVWELRNMLNRAQS